MTVRRPSVLPAGLRPGPGAPTPAVDTVARGAAPERTTPSSDRGAVTAELALALPAVVLVVAALLLTASAGVGQLRCVDAARTAARLAAVGHAHAEVVEAARRVAGDDVRVDVGGDEQWVVVTVRRDLPGAWFSGPLDLRATATAWREG